MLTVQNITYIHPDKDVLFENITLSVQKRDKAALIGNNGTGKSTLLKIMSGILKPSEGCIFSESRPYYIPQHFGQHNDQTIAGALHIEDKIYALNEILKGNISESNMAILNDDWAIEERVNEAFSYWDLLDFPLTQKMEKLSGGEKTKVFLAGILIHQPDIVLLDEPTNHLDMQSRETLYDFIRNCNNTLVVVSHDRSLLNLLNPVFELGRHGITVYGGNYEFYKEQKGIEENALQQKILNQESELRKAIKTSRETTERKLRQDSRGKRKQDKAGTPRIMMNTLRNKAEKSSSRLKDVHSEKIASITGELSQSREALPGINKMKMDFDSSALKNGKVIVNAKDINFGYNGQMLWSQPLSFQIRSGDRLNIRGANGTGKTTLIKIILGELMPSVGSISRAGIKHVYIDQDYSLIDNNLPVYQQAQQHNLDGLQEHEIKIRLHRFLFGRDSWDKPCHTLSGGEKMRLMLCCMMIGSQAPDLFILDEPTNNLDIQNTEILTSAINDYKGTVIVVSHDSYFLSDIGVDMEIELRSFSA